MVDTRLRIHGAVVHGNARGRSLGFPTANIEIEGGVDGAPERGVWAAWAAWQGSVPRMAVVNVGVRPTFAGETLSVEAHVLDFSGDLYGRGLEVDLVAKVRDERRFSDAAALSAQIGIDIERARALLMGARARNNPTEV
jgi:riboflavin kinase / FMN adenylyltransferase